MVFPRMHLNNLERSLIRWWYTSTTIFRYILCIIEISNLLHNYHRLLLQLASDAFNVHIRLALTIFMGSIRVELVEYLVLLPDKLHVFAL